MPQQVSPCPVYKKCGGCQMQNLPYDRQLAHKQAVVKRLCGRYGKVNKIIGMENPYHYRNKVQAAFGQDKRGNIISGVYQSGSHRIVSVDSCQLEDKIADEIIVFIRGLMPSFHMNAYNPYTKKGFLRHILVKRGFTTNEIMVVLVTGNPAFPGKNNFLKALLKKFPAITTVIQNINNGPTSLVLGKQEKVLFGKGFITDELCGMRFRISAASFYQINPVQTEVLYSLAIKAAELTPKSTLLDAYCGVGTIGLAASPHCGFVTGVELNPDAVKDAIANAKENGVKNARFVCGDAGEFMEELAQNGEQVDVVMMDPPRAGSSKKFIESLCTLAPKRVVYVSCNPETLARDLHYLTLGGYTVKSITPVDMFPHTSHVETVVCLSRKIDAHKMKLNATPFEMIKSGEKTIELRLYDEKRQQIKVGDKIVFTNNKTEETFTTTVVKLHRFDNFDELYKSLPLLKCGYTTDNIDTATPTDMEQYYSVEEQKKYGVVGIELFRPKQITDECVVKLCRT